MPDQPTAPTFDPRAAIFAALMLTFLAVGGISNGMRAYRAEALNAPSDVQNDAERVQYRMMEQLQGAPIKRPLGAANVVVSVLLLVGSFALTLRRKWALWLIRQAMIVNIIYIVVTLVLDIQTVNGLGALALEHAQAMGVEGATPGMVTTMWVLALVVQTALNAGLHLFAGLRAGRPAVREFLDH